MSVMKPNRGFLVFLATVVAVVTIWGYFTSPRTADGKLPLHQPGSGKSVSTGAWPAMQEKSQPLQKNHPEKLRDEIAKRYQQTFPNGDITQQQQMRLEDDWCIASSDLQVPEYERYQKELDEWMLARGNIALPKPTDPTEAPAQTRRNAAYIAPYEALPGTTLIQHASNNNMLALSVIIQRNDFPPKVKDNAAQQLLLLGDTSKGLSRLVMNELSQTEALKQDNSNQQAITNRFIKVMAMVKYGLLRKDTSALQAFLIYAQHPDQLLKGSWPQDFIFPDTVPIISRVTNKLISDINLAREQVNLPPIEMGNESKIVEMHFQEKLAFLLHHYHNTLAQPWFPQQWKNQFIPQSPCMKRKTDTMRFWQEDVPALQQRFLKHSLEPAKN